MKKIAALLLGSTLLLATSSLFAQNQSYGQSGYGQSSGSNGFNTYASSSLNWSRSYQDAVAQAQSTSKPIVILFTGINWCPACMKLEREVLTRPEFAQAVGNRFVFLKAEFPDYVEEAMANSPYRPLLDRYGVDSFPTMVVVNASGQRLYTVNYQAGGPEAYIRELMQKLNNASNSNFNNR
jgi:thiol:disulfide interchange protein